MISNDEQLAIVREQITRLEKALKSLSSKVKLLNERQFQVMSEGYMDQIAELRDAVHDYLSRTSSEVPVETRADKPARPPRVPAN